MAKMVRKAQQTKSTMKKIVAAGRSKSGLTAILINGLNDIEEVHFEPELLEDGCDADKLETEVIEAFSDAKKQLEKEIADTMDMDSLKEMMNL